MALAPPANDRKRVKVYELKNNDWFDRGTGFCQGSIVNDEARIFVQSEDDPNRTLLESKVFKGDGYQKQQDTLIVWTEENGTDMALSFQEAEGCEAIWEFVGEVHNRLNALSGPDDGLSDDLVENVPSIMLPPPELGNLTEVENMMRVANSSPQGRDALAKFIVSADYIQKLVPLVEMAEDLESLEDLHRLCNIMKTIILLNDSTIIEFIVTDEVVLGVVGALEYDPDFPCHKANHRQYLADESKFKEVVKIENPDVKKKIHYTYRLQYLKDVVLARILDDPTFSVLNSLIFFHQVEIVQNLQANAAFLKELFGIFGSQEADAQRKKDAVLFIQQCCAVAKSLQANARAQLYQNFISHGLFGVITYALRHGDASVRVAGTDILVALIDHDALMMRSQIFKAIYDNTKPLTDTLIELLLIEVDLGVKAQMADAIKVLLDPTQNQQSIDALSRNNGDLMAKFRPAVPATPGSEFPIDNFFTRSAMKLFQPLCELDDSKDMSNLSITETSLYSHLMETLTFFVRQHTYRMKFLIRSSDLPVKVARLMASPEKHLKLTALKFFRVMIGMHEPTYNKAIIDNRLIEPILNILFETMPRDNLLNSACLELFEFIKRENIRPILDYVVENYRDKLEPITYVSTFQELINRYEQIHAPPPSDADHSFTSQDTDSTPQPQPRVVHGGRWQGLTEADPDEEAYFNGPDDDEDDEIADEDGGSGGAAGSTMHTSPAAAAAGPVKPVVANGSGSGASPIRPLVNYPDEDDDDDAADEDADSDDMDVLAAPHTPADIRSDASRSQTPVPVPAPTPPPPERLSEKRRRAEEDDDEEDELGRLSSSGGVCAGSGGSSSSNKRRSSAGGFSGSPRAAGAGRASGGGMTLRKRGAVGASRGSGGEKKIAISLAVKRGAVSSGGSGGSSPTTAATAGEGGGGAEGKESGEGGTTTTASSSRKKK